MTEAQALQLALALFHRAPVRVIPKDEIIEEIKEALMCAYNDGWENGFEEGKADR